MADLSAVSGATSVLIPPVRSVGDMGFQPDDLPDSRQGVANFLTLGPVASEVIAGETIVPASLQIFSTLSGSLGNPELDIVASTSDIAIRSNGGGGNMFLGGPGEPVYIGGGGSSAGQGTSILITPGLHSGDAVSIAAVGQGANVGINLVTKGSGTVQINGVAIGDGSLTFPVPYASDMGFQPSNIANNALDLHNNASAVNGLKIFGTGTGSSPILAATGGELEQRDCAHRRRHRGHHDPRERRSQCHR